MPLFRSSSCQRESAEQAINYLLENGEELRRQFAASDPQVICLPNMVSPEESALTQRRIQHSVCGEIVEGYFTNAITRPIWQRRICEAMNAMLEQQTKSTSGTLEPIQRGCARIVPLRSFFLQGCKGVGKSYLLFLVASQLIVGDSDTRVIYIGNCKAWKQRKNSIQRDIFLARAIATAFIDSEEIQCTVEEWISRRIESSIFCSSSVSQLLRKVQAYCILRRLKVALLVDNMDATYKSDPASREILSLIRYMKDTLRFTALLAASDDSKARLLSLKLRTSDLHITGFFSLAEAKLYIQSWGLKTRIPKWQLSGILQVTRRHPGKLAILCKLLSNSFGRSGHDYEQIALECVTELHQFHLLDFGFKAAASNAY